MDKDKLEQEIVKRLYAAGLPYDYKDILTKLVSEIINWQEKSDWESMSPIYVAPAIGAVRFDKFVENKELVTIVSKLIHIIRGVSSDEEMASTILSRIDNYISANLPEPMPLEPIDKPSGPYGWICPVCGRGLSPYTSACPCGPKITTGTAWIDSENVAKVHDGWVDTEHVYNERSSCPDIKRVHDLHGSETI